MNDNQLGHLLLIFIIAISVIVGGIALYHLMGLAETDTWTEVEAPLESLRCWASSWGVWCE